MKDKALFTLELILMLAIIAAAAMCGVAVYNAGGAYAEEQMRELLPICVVSVREGSSLRVREGPSEDARVKFNLANGYELVVIMQYKGWALVNSPKMYGVRDPFGWVHTDYLRYTHKNMLGGTCNE